ncbi:MAG: hypothetical protein SGARI_000607 [Bacillariaceae sp.]
MALQEALLKPKKKVHTGKKKKSLGGKWAFDWMRDSERGMELAKIYSNIGETIEDHYRDAAFGKASRHSSRLLKHKSTVNDAVDDDHRHYLLSWQFDWERGMQLANLFVALGSLIEEHYFELMFGGEDDDTHILVMKDDREELMAALYAVRGTEISEYYMEKGRSIQQFYVGNAMDTIKQNILNASSAAAAAQPSKKKKKKNKKKHQQTAISSSPPTMDASLLLGKTIDAYYKKKYSSKYF